MTTSIHTNTSAMIALQNLNRTNDQLASTQSRVNTGLKVQGAKDNSLLVLLRLCRATAAP